MTPVSPFYLGISGTGPPWGRETVFANSVMTAGNAHLAVGASATGTSRRLTVERASQASFGRPHPFWEFEHLSPRPRLGMFIASTCDPLKVDVLRAELEGHMGSLGASLQTS